MRCGRTFRPGHRSMPSRALRGHLELVVGAQVELRAAVQVQGAQLVAAMRGHLGAGVGAQITIAAFDRGILAQLLQDTGLQPGSVADIAVALEALAVLFQLDQAEGGTAEQLGVVVADRQEGVVAAEQVLLAQLVAAAGVGDVLVGRVVAALLELLAGADAPGAGVVDHLVEVRAVQVAVQRLGFLDVVAGLAPGQADEVVGGLDAGGGTQQGGGDEESLECFHGVSPFCESRVVHGLQSTDRVLNRP